MQKETCASYVYALSISQGAIGLFADAPDNATMVTYQDVRVWTTR